MNVTDVITRVKRAFGDEAGVQILDADLIRWINDAQYDLATANNLLQTRVSTAVTAGTAIYTIPSDVNNLFSVWYKGIKLEMLSPQEAEEWIVNIGSNATQDTGLPQNFWIWGPSLYLYPIPDTTDATALTILYNKRPTTITSTADPIELDARYHTTITDYCLQQAYELDEDWQASEAKARQVKQATDDLSENDTWTVTRLYPFITDDSADWYY